MVERGAERRNLALGNWLPMATNALPRGVLAEIIKVSRTIHRSGSMSPAALVSLAKHLEVRSPRYTAETGTGASGCGSVPWPEEKASPSPAHAIGATVGSATTHIY